MLHYMWIGRLHNNSGGYRMKFYRKPIRLLVTLLSIVFLFQASVLNLSGKTIQNTTYDYVVS